MGDGITIQQLEAENRLLREKLERSEAERLYLEHINEQRQQSEMALAVSESRFRTIAATIPSAIYQICLRDGTWVADYMSDRIVDIFGVSAHAIMQDFQAFLDCIHPSDLAAYTNSIKTAVQTMTPWYYEGRIIQPNGEVRWWKGRSHPTINDQGEVTLCGVIIDTSDRKHDEALQAEQDRVRLFQAAIDSALTHSNSLSKLLQRCTDEIVNHLDAAFARIWLVSDDQTTLELKASSGLYTHLDGGHARVPIGKFKIGLIAQECRPHLTNSVLDDPHVSDKVWAKQEGMVAFAGHPLLVEEQLFGVVALFAKQPLSSTTLDALEFVADEIALGIYRRKTEAALEESEARFRSIVETVNDIFFTIAPDGIFIYVSPHWTSLLGHPVTAIIGKNFAPFIHPEDISHCLRSFHQVVTGEVAVLGVEYRILHQDGGYRWHRANISAVRDTEGRVIYCAGLARDMTEQKQVEATLKHQAQTLEQTLQELKHAQARLVQSEKMSSLGQLVAGIAHEINNPINFIHGNVIYAKEYAMDLLDLLALYHTHYANPHPEIQDKIARIDLDFLREDLQNLLASMSLGTERIRDIVQSFRLFSRLDEAEIKVVDIHEGIDSTLMILRSRLKEKTVRIDEIDYSRPEIQVHKYYGIVPLVECYAGQLNQVFMNILVNAIDVLESQFEIDQNSILEIAIVTEVVDLDRVSIHIRDSGPGIPVMIQKKLFDPFFTTKPIGKGTGLGLSISHQIVVEKHHGDLHCVSSPDHGTTFTITIPMRQVSS